MAHSTDEVAELLALAQTVLDGADTLAVLLDHLTASGGGRAALLERVRGQWVRIAISGTAAGGDPVLRAQARADLMLVIAGQTRPVTQRLLDGLAAQAAAALDRDKTGCGPRPRRRRGAGRR